MTNLDKNNKSFNGVGFWTIIVGGIVALTAIVPYDYQYSQWLRKQKIRRFVDFMSDSVFEGEMIGAGDFAIFLVIIVLVLYLLSLLKNSDYIPNKLRPLYIRLQPFLKRWRPSLGFLFTAGLCSSLFLVHTTKWIVGRARPKLVFRNERVYSNWYEFGDHFITEGVFRGSFPSGHTAAVFLFMAMAYVLINSGKSLKIRIFGWLISVFALSIASAMIISRSMSAAHWVSDSIASIFFGWAIMHAIYFWGLHIPAQNQYLLVNDKLPLPEFFEIRICLFIFLACLGIMCLVIGVRALYLNNCPWLIILSPIGAVMIWIFSRKAWKLGFFNQSALLSFLSQQ